MINIGFGVIIENFQEIPNITDTEWFYYITDSIGFIGFILESSDKEYKSFNPSNWIMDESMRIRWEQCYNFYKENFQNLKLNPILYVFIKER